MGGSVAFNNHSMKLAYGEDASVLADKRVAAVQALSGTGACRLFADFQRRFKPEAHVFIPVPTWSKYVFVMLSFTLSLGTIKLVGIGCTVNSIGLALLQLSLHERKHH